MTISWNDNLTAERATFVTHLECSMTGERYEADQLHNLSRAGRPLLVRYDLEQVRGALTREALAERPHDMWRWRELLPVRSAGEHRQPRRGGDADGEPRQGSRAARPARIAGQG
jgi:hypothetical protein